MIWDFSVIQQEHALTCPDLYRHIFQSLYHIPLTTSRWEIDKTVHFQNFRKFTNNFATFLWYFGIQFSNGKKQIER